MSTFKQATKKQAKLRCALFGPSGAGKTYTALRMAKGMGGKVALIDTEHGSASKYADRFEFVVCDLEEKSIESYCKTINEAGSLCDVLIIDSMSHAWQELLEQIDKLTKTKYKGNSWSAWSEGTPKQKKLVEALLTFPGHVIATMRTKTEWNVEKTDQGKMKPTRVGLSPEQGKGIEYEFDLLVEMNVEHIATVIKDRTGKFQDQIIEKPGEDFGKAMIDWLGEGEEIERTWIDLCKSNPNIADDFKSLGLKKADGDKMWSECKSKDPDAEFSDMIMGLVKVKKDEEKKLEDGGFKGKDA